MHDLPRTMDILQRTPATLRALLAGLPDAWICGNYGTGTWSALQVVGHLVVAERDDWMPRLRRILRDGEARAFDPFPHDATDAKAGVRGEAATQELARLLDAFDRLRAASLAELVALELSPADLARTGVHPALGRVTAEQLLSTWVVHDLHHIRQVALALAWQYREATGPWRDYLNTLVR